MSENKKKYDIEYARTKLKRVQVNFQLSEYAELSAAAAADGSPVATYIKKAIREKMKSGRG